MISKDRGVQQQMSEYPLSALSFKKEIWDERVKLMSVNYLAKQLLSLSDIQSFKEVLGRLLALPLDQTLADDTVTQHFFQDYIPSACQRLIKSKAFIDPQILSNSNQILELSIQIFFKYIDLVDKYPQFAQVLEAVLDQNQRYYGVNNQIEYQPYPWVYYKEYEDKQDPFLVSLKVGDQIDAIKYEPLFGVACWSKATILSDQQDSFQIQFHHTINPKPIMKEKSSLEIAPIGTKSTDFQWRLGLREGDQVMCADKFNVWRRCVVASSQTSDTGRSIKLEFARTDKDQKRVMAVKKDSCERIDVTSPQIQCPPTFLESTYSLLFENFSMKVHNQNDHLLYESNNRTMPIVPRSDHLCSTSIAILKKIVDQKGFQKLLSKLKDSPNPQLFVSTINTLETLIIMFHSQYLREILPHIKSMLETYTFKSDIASRLIKSNRFSKTIKSIENICRCFGVEKSIYQLGLRKNLAEGFIQVNDKVNCFNQLNQIVRNCSDSSSIEQMCEWLERNQFYKKLLLGDLTLEVVDRVDEFYEFLWRNRMVNETQIIYLFEFAQQHPCKIKKGIYKLLKISTTTNFERIFQCLSDKLLGVGGKQIKVEDLNLLTELFSVSSNNLVAELSTFLIKILFSQSLRQPVEQKVIQQYTSLVYSKSPKHNKEHLVTAIQNLKTEKLFQSFNLLISILNRACERGKSETIFPAIEQLKLDHCVAEVIISNRNSSHYQTILRTAILLLNAIVACSPKGTIGKQSILFQLHERLVNENSLPFEQQRYLRFWLSHTLKRDKFAKDGQQQLLNKLTNLPALKRLNLTGWEIVRHLLPEPIKKSDKVRSNLPLVDEMYIDQLFTLKKQLDQPLTNILYHVEDQPTLDAALRYFYSTLFLNFKQSYTAKLVDSLLEFYEAQDHNKTLRILRIINFLIREDESIHSIKYLMLLRKEYDVMLNIRSLPTRNEESKEWIIPVGSNDSVLDLKCKIAAIRKCSYRYIQLCSLNSSNNAVLRQCLLHSSDVVQFTEKKSMLRYEPLKDNRLTPQARKAFTTIFKRYSVNGLMTKKQCEQFCLVCIGSSSQSSLDDKVKGFFNYHDDDRDQFVTLKSFLDFYEEASRTRMTTVMSNLEKLGIQQNFQEAGSKPPKIVGQFMLRSCLGENMELVRMLLQLTDNRQNSKQAWSLLLNLPVNQSVYSQLLHLPLDQILMGSNPYKTLYYLYIISDLFNSLQTEELRISIQERLVSQNLFSNLLSLTTRILDSPHDDEDRDSPLLQIMDLIFEIISTPILQLYKTSSNGLYHRLLMSGTSIKIIIDNIQHLDTILTSSIAQTQSPLFSQQVLPSPKQLSGILFKFMRRLLEHQGEGRLEKMFPNIFGILLTCMIYQSQCQEFLSLIPQLLSCSNLQVAHNTLVTIIFLALSPEVTDKQPIVSSFIHYLCIQNTPKCVEMVDMSIDAKEIKKQIEASMSTDLLSDKRFKAKWQKQGTLCQNYFIVLEVLINKCGTPSLSSLMQQNLFEKVLHCQSKQISMSSCLVLSNTSITNSTLRKVEMIWELVSDPKRFALSIQHVQFLYRVLASYSLAEPSFIKHLNHLILLSIENNILIENSKEKGVQNTICKGKLKFIVLGSEHGRNHNNNHLLSEISYFYFILPIDEVYRDDERLLVQYSLRAMLDFPREKLLFIQRMAEWIRKHPYLAEIMIESKDLRILLSREKYQQDKKALHQLCFLLISILTSQSQSQESIDKLFEFLKFKKEDTQDVIGACRSRLFWEVESFFWLKLTEYGPLMAQYMIRNSFSMLMQMLSKVSLHLKEFNSQSINTLSRTIIRLLEYNHKNKCVESLEKPFMDLNTLKLILETPDLMSCVINNYCAQNILLSQLVFQFVNSSGKKGGNFENWIIFICKLVGVQDKYLLERVKLVVGKPVLMFEQGSLGCFNDQSEWYHKYTSSFGNQYNHSILQIYLQKYRVSPIRRTLLLSQLLHLCLGNESVRAYFESLPPPLLRNRNLYEYLKEKLMEDLEKPSVLSSLEKSLNNEFKQFCSMFMRCLIWFIKTKSRDYRFKHRNNMNSQQPHRYEVCHSWKQQGSAKEEQFLVLDEQVDTSLQFLNPVKFYESKAECQEYFKLLEAEFQQKPLLTVYPISFDLICHPVSQIQMLQVREFRATTIILQSQTQGLSPQQVNIELERQGESVANRVNKGWLVTNTSRDECQCCIQQGIKYILPAKSIQLDTDKILNAFKYFRPLQQYDQDEF